MGFDGKPLVIRTDANTQIGAGHLMRCLALAQAWQDSGGDAVFLSHCESDVLRKRIMDEGFDFIPLEKPHPDPSDVQTTLQVLESIGQSAESGEQREEIKKSKDEEYAEYMYFKEKKEKERERLKR